MNTYIENVLEFNKIKEKLVEFAKTDEAYEMLLNIHKAPVFSLVKQAIDEVDNAVTMINIYGSPSILPIKDVKTPLSHLRVLATLSIEEIYNIEKVLIVANDLINYHNKIKDEKNKNIDTLKPYVDKLTYEKDLLNTIKHIINDDLTINDNASPELANIRSKLKSIKQKVDDTCNKVINKYKDKLNDTVLSLKGDKLCLQVKSEYANQVEGTLMDVSGSKTTLFIEPKELTIISNEKNELLGLEKIEINKILTTLSRQLIPYVENIKTNYENIVILDFIYAKAMYAKTNNQTKPVINNEGRIKLNGAIHPLLDKNKAVPLDINIGIDFKTLIITGPNTGGKTVALKTVGLLELMALSGMFINAKENSEISFFDNILLDIGDEQSIEQNLSTFSAHMKNIIYIVKNATLKSLVLFDEICTGTDPIEGANLAMSIITTLKSRNSRIIATTHYPELKIYALTEKDVTNGSFEFDVDTLKPTYRLLIGLPGKSNAFLISEKLGLDKNIIDNAKKNIKQNDVKFEDIVTNLQHKETTIDKEKKEIEALKQEIVALKQKVERQQKGLNDREDSIIRQAKEKAEKILLDARNVANDTIKQMKNEGQTLDGSIKERTKLNKKLSDISNSLMEKTKGPSKPISPKKIRIGQRVKIMSMNIEGNVESLPDKDYNIYVKVGLIRTSCKLSDLELINEQNIHIENTTIRQVNNSNGRSHLKIEKNMETPNDINVIGKDKSEALFLIDKYLDDCLLAHMKTCKIIHGQGAGILKQAIRQFLRKQDYVEEFHQADIYDGGDGATVVTFR